MIYDEAIEEMRERRRNYIKEKYENSLDRLFEAADKWQEEHPERIAHPERKATRKKVS